VAGGIHTDHSYLRPWLDPIAESACLVFYDHRGTGRSADGVQPEELTHEAWSSDIERLRVSLGGDRIVLFGHSYGGFIAQEYAVRFGEHLDGLILCATAPAMDYPEVAIANAEAAGSPEIVVAVREAFGGRIANDAALRRLWLTTLPLYFHHYDAGTAAKLDRTASYNAAACNRAFSACLPAFDMTGKLGRIRVPTLLLAGRHDWICPPRQGAERIRSEVPGAKLVVFEHSGHFPFIEENSRFISTLADWLGALPQRKS